MVQHFWRKFLTTLFSVLGIGTLTSCYGCQPGEDFEGIWGIVAKDANGNGTIDDGEEAGGVTVKATSSGGSVTTAVSSDDGYYEIRLDSNEKYIISVDAADGYSAFFKKIESGSEGGCTDILLKKE